MKAKRILSGLIGAVMAISATMSMISVTANAVDTVKSDAFDDQSQSEITEAMGAGWNLGNQLEAGNAGTPDETAYGNPIIRKGLIQAVKKAGFKSIRIPISYLTKIGSAPDYTIDASWLNRIQEVVDYAIEEGLYVIINMHGDGYNSVQGGWLLCNAPDEKQPEIRAKYKACWEQISKKFADYDEHLIFEAMNEEFNGSYATPNVKQYSNINQYTQIFVDTVRQTGGNNAKRWLLICGWNTNIDYAVGDYGFKFPTDTYRDASITENRLMMSVHYYDPWDFSGDNTDGYYSQWGNNANPGKKVNSWDCDEDFMETQIKKMYNKFVKAGYPVVIGEYGNINKSASDKANNLYRAHYAETMCKLSKKYGCIPVYWDNGAVDNSFGLFNRNTYEIEQPEIIDAMMGVYLSSKENLNKYIDMVSEFESKNYTSATWTPFNTALTNAKSLVASSSSTEEKLKEAYDALRDAYYKLMPSDDYLKEQVVATSDTVLDSEAIEASDGLFRDVQPSFLNVVSSKSITLKFKVISGSPSADTNIFVLKPYSNKNWSGWTDNFVKLSDCKLDNATQEYSVTLDPQKILKSYENGNFSKPEDKDPDGANSINIYYSTKGTPVKIQLTYCSFSFPVVHTKHHYEVTNETFTCTQDGEKTYACTACGDSFTEEVKAMHIWDEGEVTKEENCTDSGLKIYQCTKCNETKERKIEATGHFWGEYTLEKNATCTEDGIQKHVCTICKKEETKTIKATGHKYKNGVCTVCKAKDPNYKPATTPKPTTKTPTKTTRNPKLVKKDKTAAKKAMKQAKITKLTAKSKTKKKITVSWKKVKKATGYQVQVAAKKNFKKIVFKKFINKTKLTVKSSKIKSKKTYYVRVRAYKTYKDKNGKAQKVYSKWVKKIRKVKVK